MRIHRTILGILLALLGASAPALADDCSQFATELNTSVAAWPFNPQQQPPSTGRKVFAHYVSFMPQWYWSTACPPCVDNGTLDVYQEWLDPNGENGKHKPAGGYLRDRPLPTPYKPTATSGLTDLTWELRNAELEICRARAAGIDGFALDFLDDGDALETPLTPNPPYPATLKKNDPSTEWHRTIMMMQAAAAVAPDFKIMLTPDMEAGWANGPTSLAQTIWNLSTYSSAYRLPGCELVNNPSTNGTLPAAANCLVVSPYQVETESWAWWEAWKVAMKGLGIDVALYPLFLNPATEQSFPGISHEFSAWGSASYQDTIAWKTRNTEVHGYSKSLHSMGMVHTQDLRPKDVQPSCQTVDSATKQCLQYTYGGAPTFFENQNSQTFRQGWMNALGLGDPTKSNDPADDVEIGTWNDYSESSGIEPSCKTQYAFYDLTAYYASWFKTGKQPPITRDVLYYFHRSHLLSALPSAAGAIPFQWHDMTRLPAVSDKQTDDVELLAFLTAPGTLKIAIGGYTASQAFPAGIASFQVDLNQVGAQNLNHAPVFSLYRGTSTTPVVSVQSATTIKTAIGYQNMLYHAGSSSRMPTATKYPTDPTKPYSGCGWQEP